MVDWKVLEVEEVGQTLGVGTVEGGAETRVAFQDVAQETAEGENRTGQIRPPRPLVPRDQAKKVLRPLHLFTNLGEEQRRESRSRQF
jgi:hypothetical protein